MNPDIIQQELTKSIISSLLADDDGLPLKSECTRLKALFLMEKLYPEYMQELVVSKEIIHIMEYMNEIGEVEKWDEYFKERGLL